MTERLRTAEHNPIAQIREKIERRLAENGHLLRSEHTNQLIDSISLADLSTDELVQLTGRTPLAKIEGRSITLDRGFMELNEAQQAHVILHEYSHGLVDFFASQEETDRFEQLALMVAELPPEQVSYCVAALHQQLGDKPEQAAFLQDERITEIITQYLESDRSFNGYIQAKLLEFPNQEGALTEDQRNQFLAIQDQIGSLDEYLSLAESETDRAEFLAHHPELAAQLSIWQELDALFAETDFDQIGEIAEEPSDHDGDEFYWEDYALVEQFQAEEISSQPGPTAFLSSQKKPDGTPSLLSRLVTCWQLFPPSPNNTEAG